MPTDFIPSQNLWLYGFAVRGQFSDIIHPVAFIAAHVIVTIHRAVKAGFRTIELQLTYLTVLKQNLKVAVYSPQADAW